MKNLILITGLLLLTLSATAQQAQVESLKNTYANWIKAWNDKDAGTVAKISWGNYGFGRDVPFLRNGAKDMASYEKGIQGYMDSMLTISYKQYYTEYKIIDGVGFVDGFYAQTTQQTNGPLRTVYGRQSLVFLKKDGQWKMTHYHRSSLPDEFIR